MQWIMRTLTPHDVQAPQGQAQLAWMGSKYDVTPRQIAEQNHIPWKTTAVNDWVLRAGGKILSSGAHVFQVGNQIMLPDVAVIPDPAPPSPPPQAAAVRSGGVPWWSWGLLGVGAIIIIRRIRKPKK